MSGDLAGRRLALAALRLHESGDLMSLGLLLNTMTPEELRAVVVAQTCNAALILSSVFGRPTREDRLPAIAAANGRTPSQTIADHLDLLVLTIAAQEAKEQL